MTFVERILSSNHAYLIRHRPTFSSVPVIGYCILMIFEINVILLRGKQRRRKCHSVSLLGTKLLHEYFMFDKTSHRKCSNYFLSAIRSACSLFINFYKDCRKQGGVLMHINSSVYYLSNTMTNRTRIEKLWQCMHAEIHNKIK